MKSKSNFLFFVALVFSAYSCSQKGDGSVSEVIVNGNKMYVFSLNDLKSDTTTIPLSKLVDYCVLVQLENTEEAYFKPGVTTVTEKYIAVRSSRAPYKLFSRSGKFIGNIGSVGNGPGEWTFSLYDDIIDDKNDLIYLSSLNSDKILVYNTSGQFLKNFVAPHRLQKPKMFLFNEVLTVIHMPFEDNKAFAYQFDVKTGEILNEFAPPPAHFIEQGFDGELISMRNAPNTFDFLHTNSDTLYHFDTKNNKILPVFRVTYNTSEQIWKRYLPFNKNIYLTNVSILSEELRKYVSVGMVATDLDSKISSWIKVTNDFYGNMPVSIGNASNGYWISNVQPEQLIEYIENHLANRGISEKDKQILNKTLATLQENTNNVVFIGKLKDKVQKLW